MSAIITVTMVPFLIKTFIIRMTTVPLQHPMCIEALVVSWKAKVAQSCPTLCSSPWDSPGQNTGVDSFPFSRGASQPRDQTQVSRIVDGFFNS